MCRFGQAACIALAGLLLSASAWSKRIPFPLNDYTRLGQVFSCQYAISSVAVIVPSWLDAEGGLTLTLWDSPERRTRIAGQAYVGVRDNASVELPLTKPLAPGTYYWEVDKRTGTTRIGLYAEVLAADSDECAYFDGVPDPRKRFVFNFGSATYRYLSVADMLAALDAGRSPAEQEAALRQLAVQGTAECIPRLAGLLADDALGHLARSALEAMSGPVVDSVFRKALGELHGPSLIGVMNSVGSRRDTGAIPALVGLLRDREPGVPAAAAVALGMIGTDSAANALLQALPSVNAAALPACFDAILTCAQRLMVSGNRDKAWKLCDLLCITDAASPAVREAALRGAIVARGAAGVPLLLEHLVGDDPGLARAAIWVAHHELPGSEVTRLLAEALPDLAREQQLRLVGALCHRADPVALPALLRCAEQGDAELRATVLGGLPYFGAGATPAIVAAIGDADQSVSKAAENALGATPGPEANAAIVALLDDAGQARRLAGIRLAGVRGLVAARPGLLRAANAAGVAVRLAALKVLAALASTTEVIPLLDILVQATDEPTRGAAERALATACKAAPEPQIHVSTIIARLPGAGIPLTTSLLKVVDGIGGKAARKAVLKATEDQDAAVRTAAFRLLGQWTRPETFPDLLRLAEKCPDATGKLLCLRACIRFVGSDTLKPERRMEICRQINPMIQRPDEKKLLLGMLSGLPTAAALDSAAGHLADPAVRGEAATAVLAIAKILVKGDKAEKAIPALDKLKAALPDTDPAQEAEVLLRTARGR